MKMFDSGKPSHSLNGLGTRHDFLIEIDQMDGRVQGIGQRIGHFLPFGFGGFTGTASVHKHKHKHMVISILNPLVQLRGFVGLGNVIDGHGCDLF